MQASAEASPDAAKYDVWKEAAYDELAGKQGRLEADMHLGHWPRYDYDLVRRSLIFSDAGGPRVIAEIQAVGSTAKRDWLWAWANPSFPQACTKDAERVKAFGAAHEFTKLTTPSVTADDLNQLGWELTAAAVKVADGIGAYRAPDKSAGALFLLIRSIRFVN